MTLEIIKLPKKCAKEVNGDLPRFPALKNPETTENKTNGENQDFC
jgi:hypothetical protein